MKHLRTVIVFCTIAALASCAGIHPAIPTQPGTLGSGRDAASGEAMVSSTAQTVPNLLFVSNTCGNMALQTFTSADGDVAPARTIAGPKTVLDKPYMLFGSSSGSIWAGSYSDSAVVAFATDANGNVAPPIDISGSNLNWHPAGVLRDASGVIYVVDDAANRIVVLSAIANGNALPLRTISGPSTGISAPIGLALDPSANLVVANSATNSVETFARSDSGNVAPLRKLYGAATTLNRPRGLAFDSSRNLYVANAASNSILVFAPNASGNAAPIRTIAGANTGLNFPAQLAVSPTGNIYVANSKANSVTVYSPGANGNVAPIRALAGPSTGLSCPSGIAFIQGPRAKTIYVTNPDYSGQNSSEYEGSLITFPGTAGPNTAPTSDVTGTSTNLYNPWGAAYDSAGNLWQCSRGGGGPNVPAISKFLASANGDVPPATSIFPTGFGGCGGIFVDSGGTIFATDSVNNAVDVIPSGSSGTVTPSARITTPALNNPTGVFVDSSGNITVANAGGNSILVFAKGAMGNASPIATISGANTKLSSPEQITRDLSGRFYVANAGSGVGGAEGQVLMFASNADGNVAPIAAITPVYGGYNADLYGVAVDQAGYIYATVNAPAIDGANGAILIFAPGQNGSVAPVQAIVGTPTDLAFPWNIAVR